MRPLQCAQQLDLRVISIHVPRAGCDPATLSTRSPCPHFNPRTPCGVRPSAIILSRSCPRYFNPRTPCGVRLGSTVPTKKHNYHFNPRTPCGVRLLLTGTQQLNQYFNPRTPCGVRLCTSRSWRLTVIFQSTYPVRGATPFLACSSSHVVISIHVPRAGCDHRPSAIICHIRQISIHVPRAGCDAGWADLASVGEISIHVPRAGCDVFYRPCARRI